jgi:sulfite exporter TauE/SafE
MCGPFAAFAVLGGGAGETRSSRLKLHLAYHGGRLVTYTALGGIAGLLGAALDLGGSLLGLQRAAAMATGVLMVGLGSVAVLRFLGVRLPLPTAFPLLGRWIQKGQARAMHWPVGARALVIGLLTAFLPCGWLYAFVLAAAGTGAPLWGALTLAAFWTGTVPVLAALGVGVQKLAGLSSRHVQIAASCLVIALGLLALAGRWELPMAKGTALEPPSTTLEGAIERVETLRHEEPPCCHDS